MIVFLDLEETVIDEWHSGMLLPGNLDIIKRFMDTTPTGTRLGLMSWAVYHDADKATFAREFQTYIEREVGALFDPALTWNMDEWAAEVFKHTSLKVSRQDLFDIFKKEEVLFKLARFHPAFVGETIVLIDDAIQHGVVIKVPERNCEILFLNIKQMY